MSDDNNILQNGDFETTGADEAVGATDHGNWFTAEEIEGWKASQGLIEIQDTPANGGSTPVDETGILSSGSVLELDSYDYRTKGGFFGADGRKADSTVTQSFSLDEAGKFAFGFSYAATSTVNTSDFSVKIEDEDGNVVLFQEFSESECNLEVAWQRFETSLDLAAGNYTLSFSSAQYKDRDTKGALIDNVSLIHADPEAKDDDYELDLDLEAGGILSVEATVGTSTENVTVLDEDFSGTYYLKSLATIAESDLDAIGGTAYADKFSDGELLFEAVDVSTLDTATLSFSIETDGRDRNGFEAGDHPNADYVKVEISIDGGEFVLLDFFEVRPEDLGLPSDQQTFVGSLTGKTFGADATTLSYDLPAGASSVQLRFITELSSRKEIIKFDDVLIEGERTVETGYETGLLANDTIGIDGPLQVVSVEGTSLFTFTETVDTLLQEDFDGARRNLERLDTVESSDLKGRNGVARATRRTDGELEFAEVDIDGVNNETFAFSLNAELLRGQTFESTGSGRDYFKVQARFDDGSYQTIDIFDVEWRDGEQVFVGRNSGQVVEVAEEFVELSYDLSDLAGDASTAQVRLIAEVTSGGEIFEVDNVSFTGTRTEQSGDGIATISLASGAKVTVKADGSFSYDPNGSFAHLAEGEESTDTFEYTVRDASGNTDTATVTVNLIGTNDEVVVVGAELTGSVTELVDGHSDENAHEHSATGKVTFTDADVSDSHDVSVANTPDGYLGNFVASLTDSGEVTWTFTVDDMDLDGLTAEDTLTQTYTVIIDDGNGGSATRTVEVTINGQDDAEPNTAPIVVDVQDENTTTFEGGGLDLQMANHFSDPGDVLTFSISADDDGALPNWVTIDEITGRLQALPGADADGVYDVVVTATDQTGLSADVTITITVENAILNARVSDGYVAGATVFADANGNGVLDDGEVSAITDANGEFNLIGGSGDLIMFGGTDISTGLAFKGQLRAPEGSTVLTPLTTLVVAYAEQVNGANPDYAQAEADLKAALGIPDVDLTSTDPVELAVSGDADGVDLLAAQIQVQNTVLQAAAVVDGAKGGGVDEDVGVQSAFEGLAKTISDNADFSLEDTTDIQTVISNTATQTNENTGDTDPVNIDSAVLSTATSVITQSNTAIENVEYTEGSSDPIAAVTEIVQVAIVSQKDSAQELENSAAAGSVSTELNNLNTDFDQAVDDAADEVGDVDGSVGEAISEFLVNEFGDNEQIRSTGAGLANGGFVILWESRGQPEGSNGVVKARIFDAAGKETVSEFLVNDQDFMYAGMPSVVATPDGGFLAAYTKGNSDIGVKGFDADGNVTLNQVSVNTFTQNVQFEPDIDLLSNGNIVVSWWSADGQQDTSETGVKARVLNADGTPASSEFLVNVTTANNQRDTEITALDGGGFVVTWASYENDSHPYNPDIYARLFDSNGNAAGGEFLVSEFPGNRQDYPAITALDGGGFVVTWQSLDGTQDGSGYGIKARIFDDAGNDISGEFLVNQLTFIHQELVQVATLEGGRFIVVWDSADGAEDLSNYGIKARIFNNDGSPTGDEFLVNQETLGTQFEASVTGVPGGGFVVSWTTFDETQDGSGRAIKARIFDADGNPVPVETPIKVFTQTELLALDSDPSNNGHSIDSVTAVSDQGAAVTLNADGTITYDPTVSSTLAGLSRNAIVTDTITFVVDDGAGGLTTSTVNFSVNGLNNAPTVTAITAPQVSEDGSSQLIDLLATANDQDGDTLSVVSIVATDDQGDPVAFTDNLNGTISLDPSQFNDLAAGENHIVTISFGISDGTETAANTATITVTGANDAPTVSAISLTPQSEDAPVQVIDLLATASDPDGDALSVVSVSAQDDLGNSIAVTDNGDGTVSLDPSQFNGLSAGESRVVTISYSVSDGTEAAANTATITISAANDAPVVSAINLAPQSEDAPVQVIDLLATASDPDGDALSVVSISAQDNLGNSVTVTDNGDGTVSLDPAQFNALDVGENRVVTISYGVSDGTTTTANTANVTITGVNDAPVVAPITLPDVGVDDAAQVIDLLAGATDAEGDVLGVVSISAVDEFLNPVTVTDNGDGTVTLDPSQFSGLNAGESRTVEISYQVQDGTSSVANTATIIVAGVIDTATPGDDTLVGTAGDDVISGLAGNDTISGLGGNDQLNGDEGNDDIDGGDGDDTISVGAGDNIVRGSSGNDTIDVTGSRDTFIDYSAFGDDLDVTMTSTSGSVDKGASGTDTLAGVDQLDPNSDAVIFETGSGNDVFNIDMGSDESVFIGVRALGGDDVINVTNGGVRVDYRDSASGITYTGNTGPRVSGTVTGVGVGTDTITNAFEIRGTDLDDTFNGGDGDERFILRGGNDHVDGGAGADMVRFDRSGIGAVTVDLEAGTATGELNGSAFSHTLSNIERIRGSRNDDDVISGSAADEIFEGRGGNDTLEGRGGRDELYGESGNDTLRGGDGDDHLDGGSDNDDLDGGAGDDFLDGGDGDDQITIGAGFDHVFGSSGNDTITFTASSGANFDYSALGVAIDVNVGATGATVTKSDGSTDTINGLDVLDPENDGIDIAGGDGNDNFLFDNGSNLYFAVTGGAGDDTYEYVSGWLRVDYRSATSGIVYTGNNGPLNSGTVTGAGLGTDLLINVPELRGTDFDDVFNGGDGDERFILRGGNDQVDGGNGFDTVRFDRNGMGPVTVDLAAGTATGTFNGVAFSHTLSNVEWIRGSRDDNDMLSGSDANERLTGRGGDDILEGRGGDDQLNGEAGDDTIDGGAGNDTAEFSGNRSDYTITENSGVFTVTDNRPGSPDGTDTISNVEFFQFADQNVGANDVISGPVGPVTDQDASANSVAENAAEGTLVGITALAVDGNPSDTVSYGVSDARFTIDANGVVRVAAGATFDAETESSINLTVTATSTDSSTSSETFTISVADVNEASVGAVTDTNGAANTIAEDAGEGVLVGITAFATDADITDTVSYSVSDSRFTIDANGVVRVAAGASFDAETEGSINLTVTATSTDSSTSSETFTISVADINEASVGAVTDTNGAANAIAEDAGVGTLVGITASAADADITDTVSYGVSDARFTIDANGVVRVAAGASFDAETEGSINLTVTATSTDSSTSSETFTISVADINEASVGAVTDTNGAANTIAEDAGVGTLAGITASAADADITDTVSYSVSDSRFTIDGNGVVRVAAGAVFDAETEGSINLTVTATSTDSSTSAETFTISVADVDEVDVGPVTDADGTVNAVAENAGQGTVVGITALAADGDVSDTVSYSVDDSRFAIDANGIVTVANSASFDAESEGSIDITVTALSTDGSQSTETFTISVTDVDEFDVGSVTDTDGTTNAIDEDAGAGTVVGISASAADADITDTVSYSVSDSRFTIDANGVVRVAAGASFDAETEGSINLTVTATSTDSSTSNETFAISVADVNEASVGAVTDTNGAANTIAEDAGEGILVGITAFATDADITDTVSYGVSDSRFTIDGNGVVRVAAGASFDAETEGTISLTVTATSTDSSTSTETFSITIQDVGEESVGPVTDADGTANAVAENAGQGVAVGITALATDADVSDTVSYTISDNRFAVAANGVVTVAAGAVFDFETENSIDVTITATSTDGSSSTETFTIDVADIAETIQLANGGDIFTDAGIAETLILGGDGDDIIAMNDGGGSASGADGDDDIDGGDGDDTISVGAGDNTVRGSSGNDTIDVTGSRDTFIDYSAFGDDLDVTMTSTSGSVDKGASGMDTLAGVDQLDPNSDAVIFETGSGNDVFNIDMGSDESVFIGVRALGGDDVINVTNGGVRVDYRDSASGITYTGNTGPRVSGTVTGVGVGTDTITNAFEIRGTDLDDTFNGGDGDERFILRGGNDHVDGGAGADMVRFDRSGIGAVTVDLEAGTATGELNGSAFSHTLSNIERIRGSRNDDDVISGSAADEIFEGRGGNDTLEGRGGRDELYGESGNDTLRGGDGDDHLDGGSDDDDLDGGAGDDFLDGGDGDDQITIGAGFDHVFGSSGNNTITFTASSGANFDYSALGVAIDVNVGATGATVTKSDGSTDTINGLDVLDPENDGIDIAGGDGNDNFLFDNGSNLYFAVTGGAGDDTYEYVSGWLRVDYRSATSGIVYTGNNGPLNSGTVTGAGLGTDTLINVPELRGTDFDDVFNGGDGDERFILRGGNDQVDGGNGFDTVRFDRNGMGPVTVDLAAGTATGTFNGVAFSHTLTNVEWIRGSRDDNDMLSGSDANERLTGRGGDDILEGRGGNDQLDGEDGNDTLLGGDGNDILEGHDGDDILNGGDGDDEIWIGSGFDEVIGSSGNDTITFTASSGANFDYSALGVAIDVNVGATGATVTKSGGGTDTINGLDVLDPENDGIDIAGGDGDDNFLFDNGSNLYFAVTGGAGDDTYEYVSGWLRVDYRSATSGIVYTGNNGPLNSGTVTGAGLGTDLLINVPELRGTDFDDVFNGGDGDERFILRGGNDQVDGGNGFDTVRFDRNGMGPVTVDLAAGTATGTFNGVAFSHTLTNVERIRGSRDDNDMLSGSDANERLTGRGGDDILEGRGGNDQLDGEDGNDTLLGGDGNDILEGHDGDDILNGGDGDDEIWIGSGFDEVIGSSGNDTITFTASSGANFDYSALGVAIDVNVGATGATVTKSGGGTDTINGLDVLDPENDGIDIAGGDGDDNFLFDNGSNLYFAVTGGAGDDTYEYVSGWLRVDYRSATSGIVYTGNNGPLNSGTVTGAGLGTDLLINVPELRGTDFDDVFNGGDGDERFILRGGNDQVDGGNGFDTVRFDRNGMGPVTVDLAAGTATGTFNGVAFSHTLTNVERIRGSRDDNDMLSGTGADERFDGRGGNDILIGGGGDDQLNGEAGDDTIEGGQGWDGINTGSGNDIIIIGADALGESDWVSDFDTANDTIDIEGALTTLSAAPAQLSDALQIIDYGGESRLIWFADNGDTREIMTLNGIGTGDQVRVQTAPGVSQLVTVVSGVTITGTSGNDGLYFGTPGDDTFFGLDGDDDILGRGGDDHIDGGAGRDQANYYDASSGVTVDLVNGTASDGDGGTDTLVNIEGVAGSEFADTMTGNDEDGDFNGSGGDDVIHAGGGGDYLTGDDGNDQLFGDDGDDGIDGGLGDDLIDGGAGNDSVNYFNASSGVNATYNTDTGSGTADDGDGGTDTLANIEAINGSQHDDTLTVNGSADNFSLHGDAGNDTLNGSDGSDYLDGGDGDDQHFGNGGDDGFGSSLGNDSFDGGAGNDNVHYGNAGGSISGSINTDTGSGTISDGDGGTDTLINIESLGGSQHNDTVTLTGSTDGFSLHGEAGDDNLTGGDGNEFIDGGEGNDTLNGGLGDDGFIGGDGSDIVDGGDGYDTMNYFDMNASIIAVYNTDTVTGTVQNGSGHTDTLSNIEQISGSALNDSFTFTGSTDGFAMYGEGGDDDMGGSAGSDAIYGGDGNDSIGGAGGDDHLEGGAGQDTFFFHGGDGVDTIVDFEVGVDDIDLTSLNLSGIGDLTLTQVNQTTVITGSGGLDEIRLENVNSTALTQDDFLF